MRFVIKIFLVACLTSYKNTFNAMYYSCVTIKVDIVICIVLFIYPTLMVCIKLCNTVGSEELNVSKKFDMRSYFTRHLIKNEVPRFARWCE